MHRIVIQQCRSRLDSHIAARVLVRALVVARLVEEAVEAPLGLLVEVRVAAAAHLVCILPVCGKVLESYAKDLGTNFAKDLYRSCTFGMYRLYLICRPQFEYWSG